MWYSKHHYAAHLARTHRVYFVSLPDRWRWTDLFSFGTRVEETPEGVRVVEYRNNLPLRPIGRRLTQWMGRLNAWKLRRLPTEGEVLYWSFHPTDLLVSRVLRRPGTRTIYHVVDPYLNLPGDIRFARQADMVVAINPWYRTYYRKIARQCILIPHGIRHEDRMTPDPVPEKAGAPYAVMAAGINHRTNYPLLIELAERLPHLRIVLVGQLFPLGPEQQHQRDQLLAVPNVEYAGVQHPDDLRSLIRSAAVGLVTYPFEPTMRVPDKADRTPLKVITYLAQGCPVVSSINSYVPELEGKGHFKAEGTDHFVELVDRTVRGEMGVEREEVARYLDSIDYDALIARILAALDQGTGAGPVEERGEAPAVNDLRPVVPWSIPILITSNEEWNGPRYSKHRYATALSEHRKIYFIDPPIPWRPSHLFRPRIKELTTLRGITVLSYTNAVPLFGGRLGPLNDRIISRRIRRHLRNSSWDGSLFWAFDPNRLIVPRAIGATISVYHCADDHSLRVFDERKLARSVDHVFCIAKDLMPRFRTINPSVHHVPHGLSDDDMAPAPAVRMDMPAPPGYGLYIGNINDRHDFALWDKLFAVHPDVHWVIVGPAKVSDGVGKRLLKAGARDNVHYIGEVPYPELAGLVHEAGFGFLFLRRDHPANRISSQKVVQFLAQGKPFFCSWLSEYTDHQHLVRMSDDHTTALEQVGQWLKEGEPVNTREQRLAYAEGLRFSNLLATLPFRF